MSSLYNVYILYWENGILYIHTCGLLDYHNADVRTFNNNYYGHVKTIVVIGVGIVSMHE